jgi:hypothetical protein
VSVLPESEKTIQYNLYPLIAGSVALPKLVLTIPENTGEIPGLRQDELKSLVDRSLPTHLYVMVRCSFHCRRLLLLTNEFQPQAKGAPTIPDIVKPRRLAKIK